jgi:hypothetical protein
MLVFPLLRPSLSRNGGVWILKIVDAALDAFQISNQDPWETFIYTRRDEQPHLTARKTWIGTIIAMS